MPRQFIKDQLEEILIKNNVADLFDPGELAFLTLQQKNERQIRDKVAWELQQRLDKKYGAGEYMARCEWPNDVDSKKLDYNKARPLKYSNPKGGLKVLKGRSAVDLAILKMNSNRDDYDEVVALIEFKSHLFLNGDGWAKGEFKKDVSKMKALSGLSRIGIQADKRIYNADLYFIYIMNSHERSNILQYTSAVGYWDTTLKLHNTNSRSKQKPILCTDSNYQKDLDAEFCNIISAVNVPNNSYQRSATCPIGTSFKHPLQCTCMIWGPYKGGNIIV